VLSHIMVWGVFPIDLALGWKNVKNGVKKPLNDAYILSQRCDVTFWHDVIRSTQIWAVKIGAPQIDGHRSYQGFNMCTG
jgi:hypothetical protein